MRPVRIEMFHAEQTGGRKDNTINPYPANVENMVSS